MRGVPVALAAQNGITPADVPWRRIDALFIGGDDAFKLGPDGERMAIAARAKGKWLHIGRVSSLRRIAYAATLRADSVDGSMWARWKRRWLAWGLDAVAAPPQSRMDLYGQPPASAGITGLPVVEHRNHYGQMRRRVGWLLCWLGIHDLERVDWGWRCRRPNCPDEPHHNTTRRHA